MLVTAAESERSVDVGTGKILSKYPLPVSEQLSKKVIEVGIRRHDVGRGHGLRVKRDSISQLAHPNPRCQLTDRPSVR